MGGKLVSGMAISRTGDATQGRRASISLPTRLPVASSAQEGGNDGSLYARALKLVSWPFTNKKEEATLAGRDEGPTEAQSLLRDDVVKSDIVVDSVLGLSRRHQHINLAGSDESEQAQNSVVLKAVECYQSVLKPKSTLGHLQSIRNAFPNRIDVFAASPKGIRYQHSLPQDEEQGPVEGKNRDPTSPQQRRKEEQKGARKNKDEVVVKEVKAQGFPNLFKAWSLFRKKEVKETFPDDVQFVPLPDGRRMSYREIGVKSYEAKHHVLILHGLASSRLSGLPGVSDDFIKSRQIHMVAIDRPGTGQSDNDYQQTLESVCSDLQFVMDYLNMGPKVWLLGISCGGAYSWAATYHMPHRVAGLILFCPVGYFWWKSLSKIEKKEITDSIPSSFMFITGRYFPLWVSAFVLRHAVASQSGEQWLKTILKDMKGLDRETFAQNQSAVDLAVRDGPESYKKSKAYGIAKDLRIVSTDWGFEPADIPLKFKGPIHIWQGDKDSIVPLKMQTWIKSQIPNAVALHILQGEGHVSFFGEDVASRALTAAFEETFDHDRQSETVILSKSPV